ncbi:N-acetylmuramoyl-L-alanine amidase [Limibacter armeniacum]|uniref:N-acetylmuramoyl-L-alanine amidase family protein n=1 Tax=Limibacter armeniacum TaxID=466084 RepID=UPI002FE5884D
MLRPIIVVFLCLILSLGYGQSGKEKKPKIFKAPVPVTVVIDPGHGGKDVGKEKGSSDRKHEKNLNLEIALKLGGYLETLMKNVKVVYTRKDDSTLSLDERVDIANSSNGDYFISIHCNSLPVKSYHGTQSHIQSRQFKTSYKLAQQIESEFQNRARRTSRGVKDHNDRGHNLQVLQYTDMPGVLVECGFMSNPSEEKFLNSDNGQALVASAIFRALRGVIMKHPSLEPEPRRPYYKVQVLASDKEVDTASTTLEKLDMRIDLMKDIVETAPNRFRYMVGREYEMRYAKELLKEVKHKGVKDAFIVPIYQDEGGNDYPEPDYSYPHYCVQIMSATKKISTKKREFVKLGTPVRVVENPSSKTSYKYQYLVGKTFDKQEASALMQKVRKMGFPDAFIIKVSAR